MPNNDFVKFTLYKDQKEELFYMVLQENSLLPHKIECLFLHLFTLKGISFLQPQTLVVHPLEYAGKTWQEKVADLRSYLAAQNLKGMVVSEGDEVAWLFNMRGELRESSNEYTSLYQFYPYFDSVALVESDDIKLWLREDAPGIEGTTLSV